MLVFRYLKHGRFIDSLANVQKEVIRFHLNIWDYENMTSSILILEGLTEGQRIKFIRLSKKFRQIDLASQADVNPIDIIRLEHDRFVRPTRKERILKTLGLIEDENDKESTN